MTDTTPAAKAPKAAGADVALSSDPSKDPSKAVKFDHGETPKWVTDKAKAEKEAAKDPWGSTPAQYRQEVEEPKDKAFGLSGIDPQNDANEHIVGGTLPGV